MLREMESLQREIVKEMDAQEPPEQDDEERGAAEPAGVDAHQTANTDLLRHSRTKC